MQQPRYDRFSVFLHWLMAVLIVGQIALGLWMTGLPKDGSGLRAAWFNVHKSWGMVLCLLIAVRLAWALLRPRVAPPPGARALQALAAGAHRLLYALMLVLPWSGFFGSVFSGYPIRFFGMPLPKMASRWDGAKELFSNVHQWAAAALVLLVALHVLAFLYHQCIVKDALLQRMRWPRRRARNTCSTVQHFS
ncbi:MAG: cytochrome b [Comamonadaceae bacterium]|jgi:cytochrome b561|nr:cytochrome b [Comamonadaceae bacterium]MBN9366492.1 cytochrome b [Comamonadaceae bacterium]